MLISWLFLLQKAIEGEKVHWMWYLLCLTFMALNILHSTFFWSPCTNTWSGMDRCEWNDMVDIPHHTMPWFSHLGVNAQKSDIFGRCDLENSPMTLEFELDRRISIIHVCSKFDESRSMCSKVRDSTKNKNKTDTSENNTFRKNNFGW